VLLAPSPVDAPEKIGGAKLLIISREDFRGEGIPRMPEICAQFRRMPGPKSMLVVEGSAHAQRIFETEHGEQVMKEIATFLKGENPIDAQAEPAECMELYPASRSGLG